MKYEDWVIRYGAIAGKRFSKNQKIRFLSGIVQEFYDMGYPVDVKEAKVGRDKNYNLYIGNIDKAKYVVAAYYDTPPSTYGILPYKLFDEKNRKLSLFISTFIPMILLIVIGTLFIVKVATPIWSNAAFGALGIIYTFFIFCIFALMYHIRGGIGCQSNFIRNTSSIIALLDFANSLSPDERKKIAFALTDYGCTNCMGDKLLTNKVNKRSTIIHLDSIGNNNSLYLFHPSKFSTILDNLKNNGKLNDITLIDFNELDEKLNFFQENELYIVSASKEGNNLYVRKDKAIKNYFDLENIKKTIKYLQALTC